MSGKPEISGVTKVAGVIGGLAVGALLGAVAVGIAILAAEWRNYTGYVPEMWMGGVGGALVGLGLGVLFPEKLAYALAWLISEIL